MSWPAPGEGAGRGGILWARGGNGVPAAALHRSAAVRNPDRAPTDADWVRTFVKQIRAKLGDDAVEPRWIFNERGVGHRMPGPGEE